jgi:hypothetical protein
MVPPELRVGSDVWFSVVFCGFKIPSRSTSTKSGGSRPKTITVVLVVLTRGAGGHQGIGESRSNGRVRFWRGRMLLAVNWHRIVMVAEGDGGAWRLVAR